MNFLRRSVFNFFVFITSFLIVFGSVVYMLPNANLHKKRLVDNNFYEKIVNSLKPNTSSDKVVIQNGFSYILSNTIISNLLTPTWLRAVVEKNIDITASWLNGGDKWEIYVPTREIEETIQRSVDAKTQEFVDANKKNIKVCTSSQSESIKQFGFDLNKEFCIPSDIRNDQVSLTGFVSSPVLSQSSGILNKLIKGSNLSTTSEIQEVEIVSVSQGKRQIITYISTMRDWSIIFRNNIFAIILITLGLFLANIWLISLSGRKMIYVIFRGLFACSMWIALFCSAFVLFVGGSTYASLSLRDIILPGFLTNDVTRIVSEQLVVFALELVTPALFAGLALFILATIVWLLNRFDVFTPEKLTQYNTDTNQPYKNFFYSPDDTILSQSSYDQKLHLLRSYSPQSEKKSPLSLPAPLLALPGKIMKTANNLIKKDKKNTELPRPSEEVKNQIVVDSKKPNQVQNTRKIQL